MRAHLENVHPNEHTMMSGPPTKQPRLDSYFSLAATSSVSAARQEAYTKASERKVYGLKNVMVVSSFAYFVMCRYVFKDMLKLK